MFEVKAIQAEHGDALLISYGTPEAPCHILIDGGPSGTCANLISVLEKSKVDSVLRLEALVVTHYDLDHIQGVIELLTDKPDWLEINDIWFNGYTHVHGTADRLGPKEGDELTALIEGKYCWNKAFDNKAVLHVVAPIKLTGDMKVYVLSPSPRRLSALAQQWRTLGTPPGTKHAPSDLLGQKDPWPPGNFKTLTSTDHFNADQSVPNGSSIALLLEYDGRRLLLAADAFASDVKSGLFNCFKRDIEVHLLKVSHHGSKANTDASLLKSIGCHRFILSTSGKGHAHPDNQLIARLAAASGSRVGELYFNYAVTRTLRWSQTGLCNWPVLSTAFPEKDDVFIGIEV
ncbi:hypothetical protein BTHE68_41270 [Burkholderia sp. THE68]|uniref:ComEC/Rec2 family competence protein n=1 Tax=Burkholderia sp. THE68 TaxID=758782 RepID=UPI001319299D|nr:hypothetical protein [Burkholderia sp. THE68]BBU30393.1 hypothetical protein BTHE68_41270 [Burkholderia sp. THE68]